MNCSQLNFVQSQHFYGLSIAKNAELPSLNAPDDEWVKALNRLNHLANISAKHQISNNPQLESENG